MAFIRLRTEDAGAGGVSIRFLDEQGREQVVPLLRLRISILIGKEPAHTSLDKRKTFDAILDTGSPLADTLADRRAARPRPPDPRKLRPVVAPGRPVTGLD
jgi:hypothetical protein